jgi:magnesium transporter
MSIEADTRPWETFEALIDASDARGLQETLDELGPAATALAVSRLGQEHQSSLLTLLEPVMAADLIEEISEAQAADMIEELTPELAAAIVDQLDSDVQADLLGRLDDDDAQAILEKMLPEEADDARRLMTYRTDTAGGVMITEFVAFGRDKTVRDALAELQENQERYSDFSVQYLYVTDTDGMLVGVLPIRNLLFASRERALEDIMIPSPVSVQVDASLGELHDFFEEHSFLGSPVIDQAGRLVGVLRRAALQEAIAESRNRGFMRFSGIVGGEEFRSMPLLQRSGRRLSWLSINIVLNIMAASVIAMYTETLSAVIMLAVFLPMISDMSGCSGNQAVAVSMRELALGLVRPREILRVILKEAGLGLINGVALGILLGLVAYIWHGNAYLGVVVGGALAVNTIVAVILGGSLPLMIKRMKLDPALVAAPLLTTVTDMCGFFFALSFATAALEHLK